MEILCAPNVNHDVADNLDKINGYLDALADFCTPESNVRADFYIEKTEIETIDLESLIHYYRDVLEINMVCSQIESFVNQSDVFQSIQNILKKCFVLNIIFSCNAQNAINPWLLISRLQNIRNI